MHNTVAPPAARQEARQTIGMQGDLERGFALRRGANSSPAHMVCPQRDAFGQRKAKRKIIEIRKRRRHHSMRNAMIADCNGTFVGHGKYFPLPSADAELKRGFKTPPALSGAHARAGSTRTGTDMAAETLLPSA